MTVTGGLCLAGGGMTRRTFHRATDDFGFRAVENPVPVHNLHATMLKLLGFDHERLTLRHAGRNFRLNDFFGYVVKEVINAGRDRADRADRPIQAG